MFNKNTSIEAQSCTDQVVGDILSSWRYDISGLSSEMRKDYEQHLAECPQCGRRQRLHRNIDVFLITLTTISVMVFLLAIAVIRHQETLRTWSVALQVHQMTLALSLEGAAIGGLLVSLLAWVLVAIATPAPGYLNGMLHEHQEYRERHKHAA